MDKEVVNLLDNRLVQNTKIEFSDIYLWWIWRTNVLVWILFEVLVPPKNILIS
jgi:hypothetical protein